MPPTKNSRSRATTRPSPCDELRDDAKDEDPDVQEDVNTFCDELEQMINDGDLDRIPELLDRFEGVASALEDEDPGEDDSE
jgi:hypothetical protein